MKKRFSRKTDNACWACFQVGTVVEIRKKHTHWGGTVAKLCENCLQEALNCITKDKGQNPFPWKPLRLFSE